MAYQAEIVLDIQAKLGEGPHWDDQANTLYWVDILGGKLHAYHSDINKNSTLQLEQYVSAVVPGKEGKLILAMKNGLYQYDIHQNELLFIADPEENIANNRFNDAKCDPSGRLWAGTMDMDGKPDQGNLYRLDKNTQVIKMLANVSISNGLAWSQDKQRMYYIDTPTKEVSTFDYNDETGDISNQRTSIKIPEGMGSPDGMTIDQEGMIWIAHWGGARVTRWNPSTGTLLEEVEIPAKNVTSCAFGGKDLDELYITTARNGLSEAELLEYPKSGGLFKIKTTVKGVKAVRYDSESI